MPFICDAALLQLARGQPTCCRLRWLVQNRRFTRPYLPLACSFVIKTSNEKEQKVFINVCGTSKLPMPPGWVKGQVPDEASGTTQAAFSKLLVLAATLC